MIVPQMLRSEARQLGIGRPASARACVGSHEFFVDLGGELGEWWWRLVREAAPDPEELGARLERRHREDAAGELLDVLARWSPPVLEVVERRALGMGWRQIARELPHRAWFSVTDDWKGALRRLEEHHDSLLRRLV